MARSSPRRSSTPTRADVSGARTAPDAFLALPRVASGAECRRLDDFTAALELFVFAAAAAPPPSAIDCALGAWVSTGGSILSDPGPPAPPLVGAVLVERGGPAAMLYGPVVINAEIAIAADLVATALETVSRLGVETVFARPQGLDRIWVRFGFIPVPEGALPEALRGRPGAGLFAYRGGSALWSIREAKPDALRAEGRRRAERDRHEAKPIWSQPEGRFSDVRASDD